MEAKQVAAAAPPELVDTEDGEKQVKPALKKHAGKKKSKKKDLKWDEAKIAEHDELRGTRMKIDEPNTPFAHYDSGSETDGSHNANKNTPELSWDHLQNKLDAAAAARDAYPSSPSSHGDVDNPDAEEDRKKELKEMEFKEHRKRHYNEMELVRQFRHDHPGDVLDEEGNISNGNGNANANPNVLDDDDDHGNDGDDEDERKPKSSSS
jgi:protein phosphatase inhibitor 2